ncbi:frataxin, mitochondrial-like isoform X2 [Mya arenaria]|uniref:frataxin, mitochondrial-like isoform X2 n=1 Tax=Mya arenaria TaxID=6604 RepID=UPI0022DF15CA|nr:frataxin, mitochondrial-like isoform X2 [Mya arenaria]
MGHAHTCISELSAGLTSSYNLDGCPNQRFFSTQLTPNKYEEIADETLDSLTEMFEDIQERFDCGPEYDVSYSSGVLTVKVNPKWGTYVINKQSPNKQIWFSSPKSGPKRYDYVDGMWVYKHDGRVLHDLLTEEITEVMGKTVDFTICSYGNR